MTFACTRRNIIRGTWLPFLPSPQYGTLFLRLGGPNTESRSGGTLGFRV
jgi:hypothetical protein